MNWSVCVKKMGIPTVKNHTSSPAAATATIALIKTNELIISP